MKEKKLKVFKYTDGVSTNYNLETNDYNVGTIYNWGKNDVEGQYKASERGSINKSNMEEVTEFVEHGIKEQFDKFGIEIEFLDMNEMFLMNGVPTEITFEDCVIEIFENHSCKIYDKNDKLIAVLGDCESRFVQKTDYKEIIITPKSVRCYLDNRCGMFTFRHSLYDSTDKWKEFIESVNVKS